MKEVNLYKYNISLSILTCSLSGVLCCIGQLVPESKKKSNTQYILPDHLYYLFNVFCAIAILVLSCMPIYHSYSSLPNALSMLIFYQISSIMLYFLYNIACEFNQSLVEISINIFLILFSSLTKKQFDYMGQIELSSLISFGSIFEILFKSIDQLYGILIACIIIKTTMNIKHNLEHIESPDVCFDEAETTGVVSGSVENELSFRNLVFYILLWVFQFTIYYFSSGIIDYDLSQMFTQVAIILFIVVYIIQMIFKDKIVGKYLNKMVDTYLHLCVGVVVQCEVGYKVVVAIVEYTLRWVGSLSVKSEVEGVPSDKLSVCFQNVLAGTLASNPFEFKLNNPYVEPFVFDCADYLFYPHFNRTPENANYQGHDPSVADLLAHLPEVEVEAVLQKLKAKFPKSKTEVYFDKDKLLNLKLWELVQIFDKANLNLKVKALALATLDRDAKSRNFKRYYECTDFHSVANEIEFNYNIVIKEYPEFFFYFVIDMAKRKMLQVLYRPNVQFIGSVATFITKFNEFVPATLGAFAYSKHVFDQLKQLYDTYNNLSASEKVDILFKNTSNYGLIGFCEVDKQLYELIGKKFKQHLLRPAYFPKDPKDASKDADFITCALVKKHKDYHFDADLYISETQRELKLNIKYQNMALCVCFCHLASGNAAQERKDTMKSILNSMYEVDHDYILLGDFNEDLKEQRNVVDELVAAGWQLPAVYLNTVNKERSSLQYQVNKINKPDLSAKDAIFTKSESILYNSKPTCYSDHDIIYYVFKY